MCNTGFGWRRWDITINFSLRTQVACKFDFRRSLLIITVAVVLYRWMMEADTIQFTPCILHTSPMSHLNDAFSTALDYSIERCPYDIQYSMTPECWWGHNKKFWCPISYELPLGIPISVWGICCISGKEKPWIRCEFSQCFHHITSSHAAFHLRLNKRNGMQ